MLLIAILLVSFIMTQVLWPILDGKPLFPIFRFKKIEKAISEAKQDVDLAEGKKELNKLRRKAKEIGKED